MTDKSKLAELRAPFAPNQISKLPKPYKKESPKGTCNECGGYHGLPAMHLDYVGHAALTDRLLSVDPEWSWEPLAVGANGLPVIDADGGMWIRLTVCGVTRLGYGDAQGKTGGNATKERIGDALRNAAMRFGAALDLWHKGDLHEAEEAKVEPVIKAAPRLVNPPLKTSAYDIQEARGFELFQAATAAVEQFENGDTRAAYDEVSGITDAEEKLYLWAALKEYSALRKAIKDAAGVK
jgi:hypothetical protein